jgi:Zn-dependent protease with chaperone function
VTATLVVPAVLGIIVILVSGRLQRRLRPSHAATTYSLLAAAAALTVSAIVMVVAVIFVAGLPFVAKLVPWCRAVAEGHVVPVWMGIGTSVAAAAMVASLVRAIRREGQQRGLVSGGEAFLVLPIDQPTAFAVPGDPGCVVVSSGMLRALDPDERRVLLAHERAHLHHRHHRYLRVAGISAALVPALKPLSARVRFAAERWADEEAVVAVGDRRLVARAICQAALAQDAYPAMPLAMAGLGVPARVDALLSEVSACSRAQRAGLAATTAAALLAAFAASSVQLHHLATLAFHLCPGA